MDFHELRAFDNYISASITIARLDEEGINCHLKDEYTVTIDPFLSNAIGGIKLMVADGDLERAKSLLAGYDDDYRNSLTCPSCGSHDVQYINKPGVKNWATTFFSWFTTGYASAVEQVYHCFNCSFEFENLPEENTLE